MSRTDRNRAAPRLRAHESGDFRCRHCRHLVGVVPSGGHHRNHCPFCLYSRHVDAKAAGDRTSACGSSMAPVATFTTAKGEHVIVHRCLGCGVERHNRSAADDDFDLVCALPGVEARTPSPIPLPRGEEIDNRKENDGGYATRLRIIRRDTN